MAALGDARSSGPALDARLPSATELAALRAWYAGVTSRVAVTHYLGEARATGQSSRAMLSAIRRRAARFACLRRRADLASLIEHPPHERATRERAVLHAIELLRRMPEPEPLLTDPVALWLAPRAARAIEAAGITTLAELTLRVPRRRQWWIGIRGLGVRSARQVEAFFADHAQLTQKARELVAVPRGALTPWEHLRVPSVLNGAKGSNRAPRRACLLDAHNDYDAVQVWLDLQESGATRRAYRKEVERLVLWSIVERDKALSSIKLEDALAYRAFLRRPTPTQRWAGPARSRSAPDWRPFQGPLAQRSVSYALAVLSALFRWLVEQRYVLANPFAGIRTQSGKARVSQDVTRLFTTPEWEMVRATAEELESASSAWSEKGAQRLRFVLDFGYATGLRPSELVVSRLGAIRRDERGGLWLRVVGKGQKAGTVTLPAIAVGALERYLAQRGLPTAPADWNPRTPLIESFAEDGAGITTSRLRVVLRNFFAHAAQVFQAASPSSAQKLRLATTHWMRHTHASHALERGVDLVTVRDNLRHASIATTSIYLHTDDVRRAQQMAAAFSQPFDGAS